MTQPPTMAAFRPPKITKTPVVHPSATLREVELGDYVEIHHNVAIEYATLGAYSYVQEYTAIADASIGRFVAIAASARINAPNHPYDRPTQHRFSYVPEYYWASQNRDHAFFAARRAARCRIGHDVWIGHGAIILPDLVIGDGAVIAAGAIVTRDVPPYAIVAGGPARVIKRRCPEPIAARMQALSWWDWSHDRLEASLSDFQTLSIEAFLEKHETP